MVGDKKGEIGCGVLLDHLQKNCNIYEKINCKSEKKNKT